MKLILTGYMGSGKTAVGRELSERIGLNFLDLDNEISKAENKTIPEIFSSRGEIYFRKKEAEILQELLERSDDFILSLGGGTPCYGKNLQLIKDAPGVTMVYLRTGVDELKKRLLQEKDQRPLIQHLETPEVLEDFIKKHLFERTFYYSQSDWIISTEEKAIKDVVLEIEEKLN